MKLSPGIYSNDTKKRLRDILLVGGVAVISGIIYLLAVKFLHIRIPCNLRRLTGLLCPGCGMTRALFSILRGDFKSAYSYNALSLTFMPLVALYGGFRAFKYVFDKNYKTRLWEYFLWAGFLTGIAVFTLLRNL